CFSWRAALWSLMAKLIIWVVFDIKPGAFAAFQEATVPNARAAVRDEPGCRQFDILLAEDGSEEQIALYEIYDDQAAFEAHLQTPHFAEFKAAIPDLISGQNVTRYLLHE
ncbi:MAG: putative quinol monooxygenase, partial [Alphaproteobacteria bacterium]